MLARARSYWLFVALAGAVSSQVACGSSRAAQVSGRVPGNLRPPDGAAFAVAALKADDVHDGHEFTRACETLYGPDAVDGSPNADRRPRATGSDATRHTVDALLLASWGLVGNLGDMTCRMHEKVLGKARGLEISSAGPLDLGPMGSLTQLEELTLSNDGISDASSLQYLIHLRSLDISGNNVTSIAELRSLTELVEFRAIQNGILDIGPLAALGQLKLIAVEANAITDVTPIVGLTQLVAGHFENNRVANINALSSMSKVSYLNFNGNQVADIASYSPAVPVRIDLSNNAVREAQLMALVERNGGSTRQPGQVVAWGVINTQWKSAKYVVPDMYGGNEAFINRKWTVEVCIETNHAFPHEVLSHNWPACEDKPLLREYGHRL
jgi:hypothetical protein